MKHEIIKAPMRDIIIPVPENTKDCITLIKSDCYRRMGGGKPSIIKVWSLILRLDVLAWFRLCQVKGLFFVFKKVIYKIAARRSMIDMPIGTKIGYGLYLGHQMCIVINHRTIIGNNVAISQFVNIGTSHEKGAVIHDGVYLAPSVCVVENVELGYNSTVGAGAVVVKDIPECGVAVGVPAKVVKTRNKNPWNWWPVPEIEQNQ